jgi:hypothetical protein
MFLNQLLFFGLCLNPIYLVAAMPHVLFLTVVVGRFFDKIGHWGKSEDDEPQECLTSAPIWTHRR